MENLSSRIDALILESADRARVENNLSWEVEALRLHAALHRLDGAISNTPEANKRFKITFDQNGCLVKVDEKEVYLEGRKSIDLMLLLAQNPNRVVSRDRVNQTIFNGDAKTDAIQTAWEKLKEQVGEDYLITAQGKGFVFLHPDSILPEE